MPSDAAAPRNAARRVIGCKAFAALSMRRTEMRSNICIWRDPIDGRCYASSCKTVAAVEIGDLYDSSRPTTREKRDHRLHIIIRQTDKFQAGSASASPTSQRLTGITSARVSATAQLSTEGL